MLCRVCGGFAADRFGRLRALVWRYRSMRRHQGLERHRVFQRVVAEVETLRLQGVWESDIHEVLYYLLQERG